MRPHFFRSVKLFRLTRAPSFCNFIHKPDAGDIAFYAYIVPFLISTAVGSIIAGVLVYSLQRSGALRSMQSSLS